MNISNKQQKGPMLNKAFSISISDMVGEKKVEFSSVYTMIKQLGKGSFGEV